MRTNIADHVLDSCFEGSQLVFHSTKMLCVVHSIWICSGYTQVMAKKMINKNKKNVSKTSQSTVYPEVSDRFN